jgi:Cdc6-like AAA superfamily ATPase
MTDPEMGKYVRIARLNRAFRPSAPVDSTALFSGRTDQVMRCLTAVFQAGRHIVVYGERGVGKTSLANILPEVVTEADESGLIAVRVDCNYNDTYDSLWRTIFRDMDEAWDDEQDGAIDPESVRFRLAKGGRDRLIVIDELDRFEDDGALSLLADTVKTLADHLSATTLMFVGVASSVEHLIGEHESIVRNLAQVPMPRMTKDELRKILDQGFAVAQISASTPAKDLIVNLSEGLPHFVHLLGLEAGTSAVNDDRTTLNEADVESAIRQAIASHSVMSEYLRATQSPQSGHLFEEVLIACALTKKDSLGYFRAGDVAEPLSRVLGRPMAIPSYARHLNEFARDQRGNVLLKEGTPHNYIYRFRNPVIQPFAKLVGLSRGKVSQDILDQYSADLPRELTLFDEPID